MADMLDLPEEQLFPVPERLLDPKECPTPYISSREQYDELYRQSIEQPDLFFGKVQLLFFVLETGLPRFFFFKKKG